MDHGSDAEVIKASVSVRDLLEHEGYDVGQNGFLSCPIHAGDRTASFKVYPNGRGWCCFGCHAGGDVINLAKHLYHTDFGGALKRLNDEFGLGLQNRTAQERRASSLAMYQRRMERLDRQRRQSAAEAEFRALVAVIHSSDDPWERAEAQSKLDILNYKMGGD